MRIIDIHAHAFADEIALRATFTLADHSGVTPSYDGSIAGLLASMDRAGVEVSVVQPVATKPSQVTVINDWAARLDSPDAHTAGRIIVFGAMHPDFPEPEREIARMRELGLPGIKMHPGFQEYVPNEERMKPIYRAARAEGLWMLLHSGGDIAPVEPHGTPESYAEVLDEFDGLKAIIAHMGGWDVWEAAAEHIVGRDVYLDTAYTPTRLPDPSFLELVRAHGADKVLFGSDGPWADQQVEIERLSATGLDSGELELVLGTNAAELLGI